MDCPQKEHAVGIEGYSTSTRGIGGEIQKYYEDFIVDELIEHKGELRRVSDFKCNSGDKGLFTHFVIQKKGLDTPETAQLIAHHLNLSLDDVGYAGNKDRRAITTQRMSVWKVASGEIWRQLSTLQKVQILAVYTSRYGVKLGDLWGNRFKIRIRGIKTPKTLVLAQLERITDEIKRYGIPNFFGPQRFGGRAISHLVGKAILLGQIKHAIMIYLSHTSLYESEQMRFIRKRICEEQNYRRSLKKIPAAYQYERRILRILSRQPNDFKGALSAFPRRILSLFIHAYQSWIFNKYLSERIKCLDSWQSPISGDLVQVKETTVPIYVRENNIELYQELTNKRKAFVVGPIIGYKIPLPRELPGEFINKILQAEGIHPKIFAQKNRQIASSGQLRKISFVPYGLKARIFCLPLNEIVVDLEFCLEKGIYATIVLREFMKKEL